MPDWSANRYTTSAAAREWQVPGGWPQLLRHSAGQHQDTAPGSYVAASIRARFPDYAQARYPPAPASAALRPDLRLAVRSSTTRPLQVAPQYAVRSAGPAGWKPA